MGIHRPKAFAQKASAHKAPAHKVSAQKASAQQHTDPEIEDRLDQELEQTFPASDALQITRDPPRARGGALATIRSKAHVRT